jgi:hypothetical protein
MVGGADMNLTEYRAKIGSMTAPELAGEEIKLGRLLDSLTQAYRDRRETMALVLRQLDEVRQEQGLRYIEEQEKKGEDIL